MGVLIPDEILESARLTPGELKLEIAVLLFQKGRLTLAQASRFSGMGRLQFQKVLAARQIPVNYGVEELESDLRAIRDLEQR